MHRDLLTFEVADHALVWPCSKDHAVDVSEFSVTDVVWKLLDTVVYLCRPFVVGLSDEAGAGANVGLAAKARHAPTALEVERVDDYIHKTLWGIKQDIPYPISLQDHATGGIRASLFWVPTPVSPGQYLTRA